MQRLFNKKKMWFVVLPLVVLMTGCADKNGIIPGAAPTVTSTVPANGDTGVQINRRITATFSEAMDPATTITPAAFKVTGPLATAITGTITYAGSTAVFTPSSALAVNSLYTATITTVVQDLEGIAMAADFTWSFTTGLTPDTTAPTLISTGAFDGETGLFVNRDSTATFSESMDPATLASPATSFTMTCATPCVSPVAGVVTYIGNTATFNPNSDLLPNTTYTSTITTGATDLAGNALVSGLRPNPWSWTTGAAAETTAPTVTLVNPADGATNVAINKKVNATFSEAMDPFTITTANFTVTGPGVTPVTGTVAYDVGTRIATFTPASNLAPNTTFTATITTGVKDLAGNALASNDVWTFTTGTQVAQAPVDLRSLSTFAAVAGAGLTNSNSGGMTTLNGDVGLSPTATCLGDGVPCTATNPTINGTLYANDPGGVAAQAKADLTLAYNDAAGRPPGTTVNDLSGMVLAPGVYTSGSTMSIAVDGATTLDAQGDANAVWIFQVGSSLTVNNNAQVLLINGAKASNVFWAIFASSTLGTNVIFKGNILAGASNSLGTGSTVEGRLLCRTGQITLLSNTVTVPAP